MTKVISECSEENALWAADEFINYFKNFSSIEDYLRFTKGQQFKCWSSMEEYLKGQVL